MHNVTCSRSEAEVRSSESKLFQQDIESPHTTFGRHVIADLSGCDSKIISDVSFIKAIMEEGVIRAGATIINSCFHLFSPSGVSGIILLSESHASTHTWPDKGYVSLDIYTCGSQVFPQIAIDYIAEKLKASFCHITSMERGLEHQNKNDRYFHQVF